MTAGAAVSAAVLEGDDEEGKESFGMKGNEKEEEEEEEKEQQGEKVNTKQLLIITTERAADLVHSKWLSLSLSLSLSLALFFFFFTLAGQKDNKFDKDRRTDVDRKGWTAGERKKSKVSKRKKKRSSTWLRLAFRSRHARFHPYGVFFLRTIGK